MKKLIPLLALVVALILPWAPARAEETAHDCLVVVLDGSGSMGPDHGLIDGRSKMAVAKDALKKVLSRVPSDTWIGIVVFSGRFGGQDDWIVPLGPRDPSMDAKIDAVKPGGSTPLGTYIKAGADRLLKERERQFNLGSYRLIVVTDGDADEGGEARLMERSAPEIVGRGIRLDVIGLAMDDTHALAKSATSYQPAQSADQLDAALRRVVNVESFSGSTTVAEEDFALLASLPVEVARVWLEDVTAARGNWPIGEGPPKPRHEGSQAAGSKDPKSVTPTPATSVPQPQQTSGGCSVIGFGSVSGLALLLVLPATLRRRRHAA